VIGDYFIMKRNYRIREERGVFYIEYETDRDIIEYSKWFGTPKKVGSKKVWLTAYGLEGNNETLSFPHLQFETLQKAKDYIPKLEPKYYEVSTHKIEIVVNNKYVYSEKDLVAFGNYLLSEERKELFKQHPEPIGTLEERLSKVHHSDIENFLSTNRKK
jgi:hypothetical protein